MLSAKGQSIPKAVREGQISYCSSISIGGRGECLTYPETHKVYHPKPAEKK